MDAMGNQERESNGSGQNLKKYLTICDFYETKNALWFGNKVKNSRKCASNYPHINMRGTI